MQAAGSAQAFRQVDLHYVEATTQAARAGGAPHMCLVSAAGANAALWANDWKPFHGLLYAKVKGQVRWIHSLDTYRVGLKICQILHSSWIVCFKELMQFIHKSGLNLTLYSN